VKQLQKGGENKARINNISEEKWVDHYKELWCNPT
jgi:hypothetical protein